MLVAAWSACKDQDRFTLKGKLTNPQNVGKVMLYEQNKLIDSATLNGDNEFIFHVASPDPQFYYLVVNDKNYLFVARNGDDLNFEADYADPNGAYKIEGSEEAAKLEEFNALSNKYGKIFLDLRGQYEKKVSRNPAARDSIEKAITPQFEHNMALFSSAAVKFAWENQDNLAGFYAMSSLDPSVNEEQMVKFAEAIKGKFPRNPAVEEFVSRMAKLRMLSRGQPAPNFEMASVDGSKVRLSDFRGKYVLLDFWASWCGPCRQESPNLVKQYHQFKNKGFTILSVSLDDNRASWIKAIRDDKLDWTHVSELKQWNSAVVQQYQVDAIPASFLLDKDGKILARNLRGADLESFLKKLLK